MPLLRNLLGYTGIHPDRLILDWVSSAEAPKFAKVATEFTEVVRVLGPLEGDLIAPEIGA
jgi:coenzyme F420-reducing hydrogenase delta subunit